MEHYAKSKKPNFNAAGLYILLLFCVKQCRETSKKPKKNFSASRNNF